MKYERVLTYTAHSSTCVRLYHQEEFAFVHQATYLCTRGRVATTYLSLGKLFTFEADHLPELVQGVFCTFSAVQLWELLILGKWFTTRSRENADRILRLFEHQVSYNMSKVSHHVWYKRHKLIGIVQWDVHLYVYMCDLAPAAAASAVVGAASAYISGIMSIGCNHTMSRTNARAREATILLKIPTHYQTKQKNEHIVLQHAESATDTAGVELIPWTSSMLGSARSDTTCCWAGSIRAYCKRRWALPQKLIEGKGPTGRQQTPHTAQ